MKPKMVLLDSFADPQSNRIEIQFLSEGLPRKWLTEILPNWLILLSTSCNGIKFYCNYTDLITTTHGTHMITTIQGTHMNQRAH